MKRFFVIAFLLLILFWLIGSSMLFVDQTESVYVTRFGRPVASYDGKTAAGLKWKLPWPIEDAMRIDRRLQIFDVPTQELLIRDQDEKTGEQKPLPLTFDVYACWRIADKTEAFDPLDRFIGSLGTLEKAQDFLRSQIISRLKVELSDVPLAKLVNTDKDKLQSQAMMQRLRTQPYVRIIGEPAVSLADAARQFGIDVVDIRLRRFNHPVQVREEIFAKIREDRRRDANAYRLQGEELAATIRADGEREARKIRAQAEADKVRTEGQARAEATRILNDAHKESPEFYRIVRLLDGYKKMFADDKTQLIMSLDHPLLALFKDLPKLNGAVAKPAANGGSK